MKFLFFQRDAVDIAMQTYILEVVSPAFFSQCIFIAGCEMPHNALTPQHSIALIVLVVDQLSVVMVQHCFGICLETNIIFSNFPIKEGYLLSSAM